ncbi:MAG: hypothetical protein OEV91_06105, partial [Desulfobulbaceae bacterium]|nr:hypothetical protein [Desulfobulbaceae bacterium]
MLNGKTYESSASSMAAMKVLIDDKDAAKEEGAQSFLAEVDGKVFKSFEKATDAVAEKLGDRSPFVATMGKEKFVQRVDLARAIAKNINAKLDEIQEGNEEIDVAEYKLNGADVKVSASLGYQGKIEIRGVFRVNGQAAGTEFSTIGADAKAATVVHTKPLVILMEDGLENIADGKNLRNYEKRLKSATEEIPLLEQQAAKPFAKAAELAEKRDRLEEVIKELSLDKAPSENDNTGDIMTRQEVGKYERRVETLTRTQQGNYERAERETSEYLRGLPGTILGNSIAKSFRDQSKVDLIGQRVESLDDLAIIGQIFRNPSFETNRYVFVKEGKVVNITGVTSRLPGSSAVFSGGATLIDGIAQIQKLGEKAGADGFYLLHNHPSGNPTPSAQDKEATIAIAAELPDLFLGHVVINHNSYATIHGFDVQVKPLPASIAESPNRYGKNEPSTPHPILGMKIHSVDHLASVAARLQAAKETFQVVGTSGGESLVTGIMDVPVEKVSGLSKIRLAGMLRKFARATGSARLFAVNVPDNTGMNFIEAIKTDLLHDVHMRSGESFANRGVRPDVGMLSGRKGLAGYLVREDSAEYSNTSNAMSLENLEETARTMGSITVKKRSKVDSTMLDRIFSTPEYYFKKFAAAGLVLQAALDRRDVRFTAEQKILGKDFVGYVQALRKDNKEAYAEANDYLVGLDQSGEGFSLKEEDETWKVIGPDGKMVSRHDTEALAVAAMVEAESAQLEKNGYSKDAIQAVRLARELTNRGFDVMSADMRKIIAEAKEAGLPNPMIGDGTIDESGRYGIYGAHSKKPVALFATEQQANEAMDRAAEMVSYVVQIQGGGERSFMSEIKANAWAKKHSGKVNGRKTFSGLTVRMRTDVEMRPLTVQQALAQMGDMRGTYFPRIRKPGEYVLIAKKDGENPIRKSFDLPMVGDDKHPTLQKIINMGTPMGREAMKLKAQGYDVTMGYDESPVDDVFSGSNIATAIDAILQDSMSVIDKNNQSDIKAGQQINQLITMSVADIFKARGYLSSRLKRMTGDTVWEGYETDMGKALTQYGKGIAAGTAKRDTARAMVMAFSGRDYSWEDYKKEVDKPVWADYQEIVEQRRIDPRRQKNLFTDVRAFMVDVLRNDEQTDRIIGTMKGLAVLKFLGFRVSSAAVNATNMVTGVPATMSGHVGISIMKAGGYVARAASAYGKYRTGKGEISEADKALFQEITNRGWDDAQFNQEAARELRSELGEAWNKMMTFSMFMFGAVEKANRATTLFAAYKAVEEKNPGMDKKIVWEKAKEISDNAHGVYGKETVPAWVRGKYNFLRLPYTFSKFSHNYMLNMIDLGYTRKEYKAAAYLLLSPAV